MEEKKDLINEEKLDDVSGGYYWETKELADFINAHGGHVRYDENMAKDCVAWFREDNRWKKIGLSNAYFSMNKYEPNYVSGYDYTNRNHENFMKMLHEAFD